MKATGVVASTNESLLATRVAFTCTGGNTLVGPSRWEQRAHCYLHHLLLLHQAHLLLLLQAHLPPFRQLGRGPARLPQDSLP